MALASLGGLIFGAATGMLRDISDRVFRTTRQIGDHLQADCIAVIPHVKEVKGHQSFEKVKAENVSLLSEGVREAGRQFFESREAINKLVHKIVPNNWDRKPRRRRRRIRTLTRDKTVFWMVSYAPFSQYSESIRAVKVAADNTIARASKSIGITSSLPNEGKSTVALSLAAVISQGGGRSILVDCDLRNPALTAMLTPDAKAGLLEIIAGKATLDDVLWREPVTGMVFLPSVMTSRIAHSSDVLASKQIRELFDTLRGMYDYVIVDLSPLAPVVDVRVMTPLVDSFLFVVEWGHTKIDVAQLALANARNVCSNLLGIVLNKADMRVFGRYASDHVKYYNNAEYARYGYTD
jgi:succinoglycan biosynthesis transport protein ExoP